MKKKYVVGFLFYASSPFVALIEKKRPDWQRGKLNGIGGKVEPGEDCRDAMVREFREETGATVTDWRYFCRMFGGDWEVYCYVATGDYDLHSITDELVRFLPLSSLSEFDLIPNLKWLIPLALDPEHSVADVSTYLPGEGPK
jgi:8-oxo-dGTP diphosphatase